MNSGSTFCEGNRAPVVGRFAPTPSGRMHLGNILCALAAWLSVRRQHGTMVLRIEDLDAGRCAFGEAIEFLKSDLEWLGLTWDTGGEEEGYQSHRFPIYEKYFAFLEKRGLLYPCYCSRAELHAASAPHGSDGQVLYDGRCRNRFLAGERPPANRRPAYRVTVPDETIVFTDRIQGEYRENLMRECTDFVVRRSDGVYAYQLAVVVDDGLTGVTEIVRGRDLLSSTPRQIWLYRMFGMCEPCFAHIPLLLAPDGRRLSKRDGDLDIGALRKKLDTPDRIIGLLGHLLGLIDRPEPLSAEELVSYFDIARIPKEDVRLPMEEWLL